MKHRANVLHFSVKNIMARHAYAGYCMAMPYPQSPQVDNSPRNEPPKVHVELDAPANELPEVRIGNVVTDQPKDEPAIAGYTAKELLP